MKKIVCVILLSFIFAFFSPHVFAEGYTYYGPFRNENEEAFKNSESYKQGHADGYNKAYTDAMQKYNLTVNGDIAPLWTVYLAIGITAVVCIGGILWYFNSKTRKIKKIFLPICYGIINDLERQLRNDDLSSKFFPYFQSCNSLMRDIVKIRALSDTSIRKAISEEKQENYYMMALSFIPCVADYILKNNLHPFGMTFSIIDMQKRSLDLCLQFGYFDQELYDEIREKFGIGNTSEE